jgi:DnaK suppressor protein
MALSKKFLQEIREILHKQKEKLEQDLLSFARPNSKNPEDFETVFPDFGESTEDNSNEVEVYQDNLAIEDSLERSLRDVIHALKRLDSSAYGVCKYCGKSIDEDRLRARPTSSSCVDCKLKLKGH